MSESNVEAVYPLSPMQEGILFHALYAEESRVYFEQLGLTYEGPLDVASFRRAWQRMIDRHAILRTLFVVERQKRPVQAVRRRVELDWTEEDWRGSETTGREEALEAFLRADRDRGFAITKAPPIRLSLIRMADETWQLVWSFHHILLDGWSMAVLSREVLACYEAFVRGVEPDLPPARPFRDYILWLQKQSPGKAEAFWRSYLEGFTSPSRLAVTATGASGFGAEALELEEAQGAALQALARQHRLTPSTVFQAIWALLLSRHIGERDVVFGAAFSGRPPELPGIESMVGLFIATLPVRVQVAGAEGFLGWVKRLQDTQFEIQPHQHAALVDLQSWSQVPRGVPLFESLLVFENYPLDPASRQWAPGIAVTGFRFWAHTNYPLHLRVIPAARFHLSLTYDAGRLDAARARSLLQQVPLLLEQVLASPEITLDELSLVTRESRPVLPDATAPLAEEDLQPVTAAFEAWARRTPDAAALVQGGVRLSYAELSERAHEVARALVAGGLVPGVVVALDGRPCPGLIAGLLGILFARGVVLVVDRRLPAERRRLMGQEAGARHLVRFDCGESEPAEAWGAGFLSVVSLDTAAGSLARRQHPGEAGTVERTDPKAGDPAYVFFTSGTSGVPKGVLGTHGGLSHFVEWQRSAFAVGPGDRSSQLTGLSFDVVLREIFLPLTSGATLCLPEEAGELGADRVLRWLEQTGITILHTVPTLAQAWLADPPDGVSLGSLRLVFFAGEPLAGVLVRRWRETFGAAARIVNLYGPTETTLAKCFYEVPIEAGDEVQPVGRPLPHSQALVLAEGARPCGVGEWGEIVIRTPYRTRGYVNAPDENRRRFLPSPFRQDERDILYHTGDRGRFRPDGLLEISGRLDDQVKIRGARVEPGEVAAALGQHEAVRQAAVLGREGVAGDMRLVAYVVPVKGTTPAAGGLKAFLEAKLPEHMVPSAFVFLEALPVTANGKLDRGRLPVPEDGYETAPTSVPPRGPLEAEVAAIWREVLRVPDVGTHDDFFHIGGHSLLATQVVSRVRSAFGVEIPIRRLYESPTIAGLAAAVEIALRGERAVPPPPLVPAGRNQALPLSFAQQRLFFLDQMQPGSPAYNMAGALRLDGDLDVAVLERALVEILRRHEVLRTTVEVSAGQATQKVHPPGSFALARLDLRDLPEERREEEALRLAQEEAVRPFDLVRGPLFRATLLQLGEHAHLLLVTQHHIVSDAWSQGVLVRELGALYTAYGAGRPSPLPDPPVQYADFALWQSRWLQGQVLESQLSWWKERLGGSLPVLDLPTDRPRPAVQSFRGGHHVLQLPGTLREELRALSRREASTLYMSLLASFGALLHRYTGQDDILVGSPVAGRNRMETEGLIGFFVNTLVLRLDLSGRPSFRTLLGRVREAALGAYAHAELPFERLVAELQPDRDPGRSPVFQAMMALQNAPVADLKLPGLELRPVPVPRRNARFELVLALAETADGLAGVVEYAADLFDAATIERMAGHWRRLLEAAVSEPDRPIAELPLLAAAEEKQLRAVAVGPEPQGEGTSTVPAEFERQAERTPDALAVVFGAESLTYRELSRRANRLAHHLERSGVGPEVRVGICVERSADMVVGLLGILKAGGAYVPLDPSDPEERLAFMLEDSGVRVLVTQERLLPNLPRHPARVVCLDRDAGPIAEESSEAPAADVAPGNLAYVIYTSGSTGTPKGVEVEHRGLLNLTHWHRRVYAVTEGDRATQLANLSFDASVWEMWPYLTAGASLHLPPEESLRTSPQALLEWMSSSGITLSFMPTPLAEAVLRDPIPEGLRLRGLLTGGDTLHARPEVGLPFALFNHYGPTEASVVSTWTEVESEGAGDSSAPSIGRPIDHLRAYVLDAGMVLCPVGLPGELYVGGVGLARGYHGRPDLTAERFVPNPLASEPGERLYRTGDKVRWREDGLIDFLGRVDSQVKVRGFRVELGEIESALLRHPAVRDAVAVVKEPRPGDKRIVAYVTRRDGRALDAAELRGELKSRLPGFMVPSAFVFLESMPLTPSAKVDRRALPDPEGLFEAEDAYEGPRTAVEEALSRIWSEVLRVPVVGIRDNFFELGGDSILSLQIVARAREAGFRLSLGQLFQAQTIAELSAVAETSAAADVPQGPVTGEVPLTPVQRWFFEQELEEPHHFNQAAIFELRREVSRDALARAFQEMESRHDALRARFAKGPSGWRQECVLPGGEPPLRHVDLSGLGEAEGRRTIEETADEAQRSLDLARGPLWRAVHFAMGPGRKDRLLVIVHHLVMDGVSWRVLLEDLQTACEQVDRGEAVRLPRKTTSFQAWAQRLVDYANAGGADGELGHWSRTVEADAAALPVDHAGVENRVGTSRTESVVLGEEETRALLHDVPAAYRTQIGDVLLAALASSFSEWTGRDELLVDLEGHGREDLFEGVDLSRTVGWFTTIYPVRLVRVPGGPGESLKAIKEQLRGLPRRGIGYGVLRYLRGAGLRAQPQVSFNYLGRFDQVLGEGSLFAAAGESAGPTRSERGRRAHLIDVNGVVAGGRLRLDWTYCEAALERSTVQALARSYETSLLALVDHCRSGAWGVTPSDFPLAGLDQAGLDRVIGGRREVEDVYPLAPMQEGMLLHTLVSEGSGLYVEQGKYELSGRLDATALRRAWQRVMDRHPILRTRFCWEGLDRPLQVVDRTASLPWEEEDWTGVSPEELGPRFEKLLKADRERGIDLGRGPLMRMRLVRLGESSHRLLWSFHHALLDGWSVPLLWTEVLGLYHSHARGDEAGITAARPYRDYISWLAGRDRKGAERFWRKALEGFRAPTTLSVDRGEREQGSEVEQQTFALSEAVTAALKRLGRRHGLTLNTLVQGAWAVLLGRYSGERDVVFGVTVSGRPAGLPGVESMVGLFINTQPLRVAIADGQPVLEWLKGLQAVQAEQRPYEYASLADVQTWSEVEAGRPLFESLLVFENYPVSPSLLDPAREPRVRSLGITETTNYPLILMAGEASVLGLRLIFDRRRFEPESIGRMGRHLVRILEALAPDVDHRVGELPLLTDEEAGLLSAWNATVREYPREKTIADLFELQVARSPESVAVSFEGRTLSYGELNRRSNQLAHHLSRLGVGPEVRVGICVERSLEMVVGLLGIVKSGGAYVPLDPDYPGERLSFLLEDAEPAVLLTQERLLGRLGTHGARVVCLDRDWAQVAVEAETNPWSGAGAESLAYVTYTSGSTGKPKGVEVRHRGVVRLLFGVDYAELGAGEVLLQLAPVSFDASTLEVWGALLHGGRCVVYPDRVPTGQDLGELVSREGVTTLWLTSSLYNAVLDESPEALRGVKQLLIGGEALSVGHVRRGLELLPGTRIINGYGPTESTTFTCCYGIPRDLGEGAVSVPIGRPIGNTRVYVLDRRMEPVPIGVGGELFIGGDGLARGYLKRPELTAEKFVPDPFGEEAGGRLYRTGDLVRYLADGNLEFLGRADHQVKVRGYRIELGEIESALCEQPGVKDAVAIVREDHPGDKRLVAYVVGRDGRAVEPIEARSRLKAKLPEHMVPSAIVSLESLPLSPNGKVDRRALPAPEARPASGDALVPPRNDLEETIAALWREVLHLDAFGVHDNFFDLGGHSLTLLQTYGKLRQRLGHLPVRIVDLFQFPTIAALAAHLSRAKAGEPEVRSPRERARRTPGEPRAAEDGIAIIGMVGRFPGARDVEEFWCNLREGVESISRFSPEELLAEGVSSELLRDPRYVGARGVLEGADLFDATFFGYTPREAQTMDPQQRVFLESAWSALEKAGYDSEKYRGRIGVYAGTSLNNYLFGLVSNPEWIAAGGGTPALIASDKDFLTTRVSYKLNLRGPSIDVQTACSTSLVAVHLACRSLLGHECDMALAGGVSVSVPQKAGYLYLDEGIRSPDGHCRAFDRRAQGTVGGSGVGVVVLKRLRDALADGDAIEAVIRGSAINNDGALKVGYTAPGVDGQAEVIALALAAAGVGPETIDYVETHGTGTALGDPVELQALRQVFGASDARRAPCAIGSLKTNVGHLDAAAGVAGLIKTVLALKHREIPPSLHFEEANPSLQLEEGLFRVNARLSDWPANGSPRRAGVSSFGIGGTNAHVVLEEAPPVGPQGSEGRTCQLLILSAKTPGALDEATRSLSAHLARPSALTLGDLAFTLQEGRRAFRHRRAAVVRDLADAARVLGGSEPGRWLEGRVEPSGRRVAFLFPGQGAQHPNMGRGLHGSEEVFRTEVDRCAEILRTDLGFDLKDVLFPAAGQEAAAGRRLDETAVTQPALFTVEYALARLWMAWGIEPEAMLGHSVGEYVAACLAGVFSLEDALSLVAARGRLMQDQPKGSMLAVALPEAELRALLDGSLDLAAVNGPSQCVASGPEAAVAALHNLLSARGVEGTILRTSHAFHSSMMEGAIPEFCRRVAQVERRAPRIPFVSNITGSWITASEAQDPGYWARHLRATVRFEEGLSRLLKDDRVLLEVGPGQALSGLARAQSNGGPPRVVVASARHPRESRPDEEALFGAVGRLWLAGVAPDWNGHHAGARRRRVGLPTYCFEGQRYWLPEGSPAVPSGSGPDASTGKNPDLADWFYLPTWKSSLTPSAPEGEPDPGCSWLVLGDPGGLGSQLAGRLRERGHGVVSVGAGPFTRLSADTYTIDLGNPGDSARLLGALSADGRRPRRIVHLWSLDVDEVAAPRESFEQTQARGFSSLLFLARALGAEADASPRRITVITNGVEDVTGADELVPEKRTLLGACAVIPQELPGVSCRVVDLRLPEPGPWPIERLDDLIAECEASEGGPLVAYRGPTRWVQAFDRVRLEGRRRPVSLRPGGVYLISGGLGRVGLCLADHLARAAGARLVLVGRSPLPERAEWDRWLASHGEHDVVSRRIRAVRKLESHGAEVWVASADVASPREMAAVVGRAVARFGDLHGVIHAAGVTHGASFRPMAELGLAECEEQFRPKVLGLYALEKALEGRSLDFWLLTSSLSTVLGGIGMGPYAAANAFMDGFAHQRGRGATGRWLSVNWDGWQFDETTSSGMGAGVARLAMTPAEGIAALERILASGVGRVVVSTGDLQVRIEQWVTPQSAARDLAPTGEGRHPRPALASPYVAPRGEVEQAVAEVWQELFGFERVGVDDSFFDLGGDSLLAMQVVNRLRQTFHVPLKLQALFEAPTVAELARLMVDSEPRPGLASEIARLARSLESLSEIEVERMLQEQRASGGAAS